MTSWSRPPVPPELGRLAAFEGDWISRDEHAPSPWAEAGGSGRSRHVTSLQEYRRAPGDA